LPHRRHWTAHWTLLFSLHFSLFLTAFSKNRDGPQRELSGARSRLASGKNHPNDMEGAESPDSLCDLQALVVMSFPQPGTHTCAADTGVASGARDLSWP